jgi:hypothetical protein
LKKKRLMKSYNPDDEKIFYLFPDDGLVWFMNNSNQTLPKVAGSEGGFITVDEDVATRATNEASYNNVKSGEAVSIGVAPDGFYDLDYVIVYYVRIETPTNRVFNFNSGPEKGGDPYVIFRWNSKIVQRNKRRELRKEQKKKERFGKLRELRLAGKHEEYKLLAESGQE